MLPTALTIVHTKQSYDVACSAVALELRAGRHMDSGGAMTRGSACCCCRYTGPAPGESTQRTADDYIQSHFLCIIRWQEALTDGKPCPYLGVVKVLHAGAFSAKERVPVADLPVISAWNEYKDQNFKDPSCNSRHPLGRNAAAPDGRTGQHEVVAWILLRLCYRRRAAGEHCAQKVHQEVGSARHASSSTPAAHRTDLNDSSDNVWS